MASDTGLASPLWRLMVTLMPWSTTSTGPGVVAGPALVEAKPQIGTGAAAPGSTMVPAIAHNSQVAVVAVNVQPDGCSEPTGGASAGTGTAAGAWAAAGTAAAAPIASAVGAWGGSVRAAWAAAGAADTNMVAARHAQA